MRILNKLVPNLEQTRRHLKAIDHRPNTEFTFQTFLDGDGNEEEKRRVARIFHGTLDDHAEELTRLNCLGAGIFVTVNETDGRGRKAKNIVAVRAVFADKDDGPLPPLPIDTSFVIESKRGDHPYWLVDKNTTMDEFTRAQKAIVQKLKSDPKVCDPSRVMRLAGFYHLKDRNNPFLVKIKSQSKAKYTIKDIFSAFPPAKQVQKEKSTVPAALPFNADSFSSWAATLPTQRGSENTLGGRNNTLLMLIREGLACGMTVDLYGKITPADIAAISPFEF